MEAFSATLERRLQLTVRTPSGILVITFYSNIGLGRNWLHWKAKKKICNLRVQTAINRTKKFSRPDGPAENSRILFRQVKLSPSGPSKAPVRTRVPQTPFFTQNRVS
jgi:hypothetical protein